MNKQIIYKKISKQNITLCRIRGSHSGGYEEHIASIFVVKTSVQAGDKQSSACHLPARWLFARLIFRP
jgi:hypothetical protein